MPSKRVGLLLSASSLNFYQTLVAKHCTPASNNFEREFQKLVCSKINAAFLSIRAKHQLSLMSKSPTHGNTRGKDPVSYLFWVCYQMSNLSAARPTARCAPASNTPSRSCRFFLGIAATVAEIASQQHVCRCQSCGNRSMTSTIVSRMPAAAYAWGEHRGRRYGHKMELNTRGGWFERNSTVLLCSTRGGVQTSRKIEGVERVTHVCAVEKILTNLFVQMPSLSVLPTVEKSSLKLALCGRGSAHVRFVCVYTSAKLACARQVSTTSLSPLSCTSLFSTHSRIPVTIVIAAPLVSKSSRHLWYIRHRRDESKLQRSSVHPKSRG